MSAITSKRGDTGRTIRGFLKLNGVAIPLAGATVALVIKQMDSGTAVRRAATIVDAVTAEVRYQPVAGDVAIADKFRLEWEITFADGKVQTVPDGPTGDLAYDTWTILNDLG